MKQFRSWSRSYNSLVDRLSESEFSLAVALLPKRDFYERDKLIAAAKNVLIKGESVKQQNLGDTSLSKLSALVSELWDQLWAREG